MKRIPRIMIAMFAFTWVVIGADNTLGTWKYNAAKSKRAEGASPYSSLTLTREGIDGGVRAAVHVETADGNKADGVSTAKYDGKPVAVEGKLQWDMVAEKQIDANTVSAELTMHGSSTGRALVACRVLRRRAGSSDPRK